MHTERQDRTQTRTKIRAGKKHPAGRATGGPLGDSIGLAEDGLNEGGAAELALGHQGPRERHGPEVLILKGRERGEGGGERGSG